MDAERVIVADDAAARAGAPAGSSWRSTTRPRIWTVRDGLVVHAKLFRDRADAFAEAGIPYPARLNNPETRSGFATFTRWSRPPRRKGRKGSLNNPEIIENVPGHVIPILEREFDDFDNEAEKFLGGETEETEFIGFRLKQGVYGQRQADVQMIRIKLPMGGVTPEQMDDVRRRRRGVRAAEQGPHHHAPEHPDPPHPAAPDAPS